MYLIDIQRKIILEKVQIEKFKNRRILHITTATLEWLDTRLTYAAVVARGSPFIEILAFKHNENKIRSIFSINTCPELENPLKLEANSKQTYLMLPCNVTFSFDGEFLQTTNHDGRVRIFKMPPVLDPLTIEKQLPKEDS